MTTEQHKQIASELFARISSGKIADALALMTDDATWRIGGTPELSRSAGLYDKARLGRLFERMLSQLEDGLKMKTRIDARLRNGYDESAPTRVSTSSSFAARSCRRPKPRISMSRKSSRTRCRSRSRFTSSNRRASI